VPWPPKLENGAPISAETARRLACDAFIVAAVLGITSEVFNIGGCPGPYRARCAAPSSLVTKAALCLAAGGRHAGVKPITSCTGLATRARPVCPTWRCSAVAIIESSTTKAGPCASATTAYRFPTTPLDRPDQTEQPAWKTTWQLALDHIPIPT
jgi:hypothetical protein